VNELRAATAYFAGVYFAGFVLGTIRVLWWNVSHPPERYILVEVPVLLMFAWFLCGVVVRRCRVAMLPNARLRMGALAFVMLMACELLLGWVFERQTPIGYVASLGHPVKVLVLCSQALFGTFPLLRLWLGRG
jgi:hypothetical protein